MGRFASCHCYRWEVAEMKDVDWEVFLELRERFRYILVIGIDIKPCDGVVTGCARHDGHSSQGGSMQRIGKRQGCMIRGLLG